MSVTIPSKTQPSMPTLSSATRRVSRGRAKGPPLEIEKQKKKKKNVIGANFKLFHLYFDTFLVENIIFSAISDFGPSPPYEFLDTRLATVTNLVKSGVGFTSDAALRFAVFSQDF